ncbi:MAG: YggS family pyridoxal phosphate-dependent enzyme [Bacteroidales bacterium]|nr:YggS family pyridoxal phosphate-dependent enzyme [Bacteroidales bacterium]
MNIQDNLIEILNEIPEKIKLVAVSKTKPVEDILEAYNTGHKTFGENKAQELIIKQPKLPNDIKWHFIGHLQTNKVKYIAPFVSMIESVDSLKLLKEINKQAKKNNRIIDCLLQFHIATEETKFGLNLQEAEDILNSPSYLEYQNIRIAGVMGMATFTDNKSLIRDEFRILKQYFTDLKQSCFINKEFFKEISMGMSDDYKIAIEEGSTIVRIGSIIFGKRQCSYSPA